MADFFIGLSQLIKRNRFQYKPDTDHVPDFIDYPGIFQIGCAILHKPNFQVPNFQFPYQGIQEPVFLMF